MMSDDADDVDADGTDDNVGDNDGLFFSLAWRRRTGTCRGACLALSQARSMREGETARGRYAKPHFHHAPHATGVATFTPALTSNVSRGSSPIASCQNGFGRV